MDVSIILVNYNTKELTSACINSIYQHTSGIDFEVILVDNASKDGSKEVFSNMPGIRYIYNDANLGFGAANNVGARVATGKYLFILNSDTLLLDNSIKKIYDYMEAHTEYAYCGVNLVNGEHKNVAVGGQFPTLASEFYAIGFYKMCRKYHKKHIAICQTADDIEDNTLDYIIGADIFIRTEAFRQTGGFDESFFMYYEETDLCKRLAKAGHKPAFLPDITIVHLVGQSTGGAQVSLNKYRMINTSKMHYYKKHHSLLYRFLVRLCEFTKIVIRPYYYKKDYFALLADAFTI